MNLRRGRPEPDIPTASMADIAFMLIVLFMVTTVVAVSQGLSFTQSRDEGDQLAAGNGHSIVAGEGIDREQNSGRVVIDYEGTFASRDGAQQSIDPPGPARPRAGFDIHLQIGVPGGSGMYRRNRRGAQHRSAKVGMEDDARRVDHAALPVRDEGLDFQRCRAAGGLI